MRDIIEEDKWLILGLSRGQVVFVNVYDLTIIHSRYDVANSEVVMIREIVKHNCFLVLEKMDMLTLCEFKKDRVMKYH